MPGSNRRLRGWKSIAAYLSVTESTAIRWSKRPGFPVVRSSDGGSVYAMTADLDLWLAGVRSRGGADDLDAASAPDADLAPDEAPRPTSRRGLVLLGGSAVIAVAATACLVLLGRRPSAPNPEIRDPELQALYIDARSEWAARTRESLDRAAEKFRDIVARYPDFGPGFTGLADTYILSCEFGSTDRDRAFRAAHAAVSTALALDPRDGAANRIMGFLVYWTSRDVAASRPFFEKAVAADQTDDLIPLWYGNALIDGGRVTEGLAQLRRAVLLAPDSPAVLTDYAMGLWQAGQSAPALSRLADVETRFPLHSAAPGAAALFDLQAGDLAAYLEESRRWADLIGDDRQKARLVREARAFATGGRPAVLGLMARSAPIDSSFWHGGELPVAMAASMIGDRGRLVEILTGVAARQVTWRNLRFPAETFVRWSDDVELRGLLRRVLDPGDFPDYPRG